MTASKIAPTPVLKAKLLDIGELHVDGLIYFRVTSQDFKMLQDQADFSFASFGCRTSASGEFYAVFFCFSLKSSYCIYNEI